ncbi:D-alanyl-D-alanine carboxypeptidase/D-alanyl-D-alanine endopeptidase [Nioella nitratireducens]|uniref:D-alanyl-D-alanine carboxypeptidase/D-alanyl-D-alanine endopeptidase n=1 Tax=Nioella nitratireducens TaxID=1287720 RepID=UPI0008FD7DCD|nr:D-alanyl-D-alanine carboxypeptidase/D-alanyl-D-alanine-endopeptidase [Nioella nitratireducens]
MVSRRAFLGGALASVAGAANAFAPEVSRIPLPRPDGFFLRTLPSAADLIARAGLGGRVACVVADARSGQVLESVNPLVGLPPASVTKALTSAYALDRLGPGYRFHTQVVAEGTLTNGRLDGDLWLVGGADPVLDTDALNDIARDLAESGLREVTGRFRVAHEAVPHIHEIDPDQPAQVGYNPAVSGLNLNFNRVHFEWERGANGYTVQMDARSASLRPPVTVTRMDVIDRGAPIYDFEESDEIEQWSVARGALGQNGARWLPVRRPHMYAAEVFQVLARSRGIVLDAPVFGSAPPETAQVLVNHVSDPLEEVLRGMMRWSTNLTAEVAGLLATEAGGIRPVDLRESADQMNAWLMERYGLRRPRLVDHSGLGDESRINARDMVRALVGSGANGGLRRIMKDIPMLDDHGNLLSNPPAEIVAKTGTLYFVSSLAGYARLASGRDLAFAIFCGDLERRTTFDPGQEARPPGARSYNTHAKLLQQALLRRWTAMHG